ncbi:MAG: hypothetical protein JJU15_04015 [Pararhodobacter sp.]|nr:hypothetical protein [Pararhodobacter sp.]
MEKTVIALSDHKSPSTEPRDNPTKVFALPEAPMPMPVQNLSPADRPRFSLGRWLRPQLMVRS